MWNSVFVSVCGVIQQFETQQFGSVKQYDIAWLRWGEGVGDWCHSCVTCVSLVWSHGHTGHWRHQLEYTQRHIHYILSGNKHQSMLNIIYWRQKCQMDIQLLVKWFIFVVPSLILNWKQINPKIRSISRVNYTFNKTQKQFKTTLFGAF